MTKGADDFRRGLADGSKSPTEPPASSHHKQMPAFRGKEDLTMKMLALGFLAITAVTIAGTDASHARNFCYHTNSGAFAHWGACRVVCNHYGPGGYCRKVTW
jgi:hypothetical protein